MDNCIYGVDLSKEVTPIMVRDAIINCFLNAHSEILDEMKEFGDFESEKEFEKMKLFDIKSLIEKYFEEVNGDFDNPTKESLLEVIGKLQEFAKNFRKPKIVNKHSGEIMKLIKKLS
ncbi:hypothetical protein HN827_10110 [archaeon]|jgi:hypothetical protein|nr:hypothetical protein [archaeon]MBT7393156.1 hypothetical protein [archaeon]